MMQELFNQFNPVNLQAELERARMDDRIDEARDAAREYYTDDPDA